MGFVSYGLPMVCTNRMNHGYVPIVFLSADHWVIKNGQDQSLAVHWPVHGPYPTDFPFDTFLMFA
jgi:hypothetical protein